MTGTGITGWRRGICRVLIPAFLLTLADFPALARPGGEAGIRVTNQVVHIEGDVALISYDLEAPGGGPYVVTIELRRENDPSFSLVPSNLSGDIGEVASPGPGKLIRWEYLRDFPIGLRGEDFYFKIEASRSGGFPWLWIALGSAVVAGGVVAIVAGKSSPGPSPSPATELPLPPAR